MTGKPGRGELLALRVSVGVLALIPVATGVAGVLIGPTFVRLEQPWPADLDSHFRFLSGVFLAIGIGFFSTLPRLGEETARFRLLAALVFAGGLARLLSLVLSATPSAGHVVGLSMELVVVPMMVIWQARLVRRSI